MKVIDIHNELYKIIDLSIRKDRQAQKKLYERYSPKLLSICRQYIRDSYSAEDIMVTSFMKVFKNLHTYERKGNFEGWIRRITVNECISFLRIAKNQTFTNEYPEVCGDVTSPEAKIYHDEIQDMVDNLPEGCKMVFMLYAVEGYKHQEIASMLEINEGTSKSQLAYARKLLQTMVEQENKSANA